MKNAEFQCDWGELAWWRTVVYGTQLPGSGYQRHRIYPSRFHRHGRFHPHTLSFSIQVNIGKTINCPFCGLLELGRYVIEKLY